MKIKYSPCKHNRDTLIKFIDENSIMIDDELYEFDTASIEFPDIAAQTNGCILSANRNELGELSLTVRRFYTQSCQTWDTGDYHEING